MGKVKTKWLLNDPNESQIVILQCRWHEFKTRGQQRWYGQCRKIIGPTLKKIALDVIFFITWLTAFCLYDLIKKILSILSRGVCYFFCVREGRMQIVSEVRYFLLLLSWRNNFKATLKAVFYRCLKVYHNMKNTSTRYTYVSWNTTKFNNFTN